MAWELQHEERAGQGWWYLGACEQCTFEFSGPPEQIPGTGWMINQIVQGMKGAMGVEEGQLLYLKVYCDPAEWYRSKWRVVATAHGSPLAWAIIIPLALVALIVIGFLWIIRSISSKWWFGPAAIAIAGGVAALGTGILIREIRSKRETS